MSQLLLPWTNPDDFGGMDQLYLDYAPPSDGFMQVFHFPEGIKRLEGEYTYAIMNFNGDADDYYDLRDTVLRDEHLHIVIRNNLIDNLDRVWKERQGDEGASDIG